MGHGGPLPFSTKIDVSFLILHIKTALCSSEGLLYLLGQNTTYISFHPHLKFSLIMDLTVGTAIGIVHESAPQLEAHYPGILSALEMADKNQIGEEDYARRILNSVKNTPEFLDDVTRLLGGLDEMLIEFMDGKSAEEVTRDGFKIPLSSGTKKHFDEIADKLGVRS